MSARQYRSAAYWTTPEQRDTLERSKAMFEKALRAKGFGPITTEIAEAGPFYFAEDYHQQYLAKNPRGYCGLGGTGVSLPHRHGRWRGRSRWTRRERLIAQGLNLVTRSKPAFVN